MDENQRQMATFLGYEEVEISREIKGKKSVKVKCLPVRQLAEYAALIDVESELVGLCTDLTPEQVDQLSAEDSGKIFEKAHELNFKPFSAWVKRKVKAQRLKAQAYGIDLPKNENEASGNSSTD